jgi:hypothetical protein
MLIQVTTKPVAKTTAIEVSQFHMDVAKIALHGVRQAETVKQKMLTLVRTQYGETAPTFAQYKADLKALKAIAAQRKLADAQWLHRPYGAALKEAYGALPVSQDPAAVLKRAQRDAMQAQLKAIQEAAKQAGTAPKAGAPAGETQERTPSPDEQIESVVARLGVFETLAACIRILESDDATKAQATHMAKMLGQARKAQEKADKEARVKAITPQA